jgi:uncharacterized membrane protein
VQANGFAVILSFIPQSCSISCHKRRQSSRIERNNAWFNGRVSWFIFFSDEHVGLLLFCGKL